MRFDSIQTMYGRGSKYKGSHGQILRVAIK